MDRQLRNLLVLSSLCMLPAASGLRLPGGSMVQITGLLLRNRIEVAIKRRYIHICQRIGRVNSGNLV